jgi:hypothetical protein
MKTTKHRAKYVQNAQMKREGKMIKQIVYTKKTRKQAQCILQSRHKNKTRTNRVNLSGPPKIRGLACVCFVVAQ